MIQDIAPHAYEHDYNHDDPMPDDFVLAFRGREVLARVADDRIAYPSAADFASAVGRDLAWGRDTMRLVGVDGTSFHLWWGEGAFAGGAPEVAGYEWVSVSRFRVACPQWMSFAGITGLHLFNWYRTNRFCGCCGHAMEPFGPERAMRCPSCGNLAFPRISPAVIIGLTDGADRIVMSRYAGRDYKDVALLAGFIEIGETPEDAVRREVAEEVGLCAANIRYAGSQPCGMDGDLLLGYFCDVEGPNEIRRFDHEELSVARWVDRSEVAQPPNTRTLTYDMIERFRTGRETR